mmetsp:Transcript_9397/g.14339  ORF Transcript_9397/g.14339 Transcript_9397/m.14339 type:complete len:284 (+) Transcript_9397:1190-2041(+)|eukprot:CAMPEP_0170483096 /NCGR_PEP_ID=MMETSP0208-20121228/2832_1 /TAXON_ID=197538 /ORGANISM="Strombidium inclinatum, Strain S3" /LENGTH=283 /DNA_ID=CAMNT_0010756009 /DNA_START=1189 /DNA_END=2040 /DNA_ORIENTATION=-
MPERSHIENDEDTLQPGHTVIVEIENFEKYAISEIERSPAVISANRGNFFRLASTEDRVVVYTEHFDRFYNFYLCGIGHFYSKEQCALNPTGYYSIDIGENRVSKRRRLFDPMRWDSDKEDLAKVLHSSTHYTTVGVTCKLLDEEDIAEILDFELLPAELEKLKFICSVEQKIESSLRWEHLPTFFIFISIFSISAICLYLTTSYVRAKMNGTLESEVQQEEKPEPIEIKDVLLSINDSQLRQIKMHSILDLIFEHSLKVLTFQEASEEMKKIIIEEAAPNVS